MDPALKEIAQQLYLDALDAVRVVFDDYDSMEIPSKAEWESRREAAIDLMETTAERHHFTRHTHGEAVDKAFAKYCSFFVRAITDNRLEDRALKVAREMLVIYEGMVSVEPENVVLGYQGFKRLDVLLIEWDRLREKTTEVEQALLADDDLKAVLLILRELRDQARVHFNNEDERVRQETRAMRIQEKRAQHVDAQPMGRKCSDCGKRDAVFDNLCKRCADAAGVRPHGKVA